MRVFTESRRQFRFVFRTSWVLISALTPGTLNIVQLFLKWIIRYSLESLEKNHENGTHFFCVISVLLCLFLLL